MSDFNIIYLLIVILFSAWLSLYITKDILNPVFIFIIGIYINYTLSFTNFSKMQISTQNIDKIFLSIYYFSGLTFIIFPLILLSRIKKPIIYRYELISYNSFAKKQSYFLVLYAILVFFSNYLLSGSLMPLFQFDVFSAGLSLHTRHIPLVTTLIIPSLGFMVFFEGLFYKNRATAICRTFLFIFLPVTRGSRLLSYNFFLVFFIGFIFNLAFQNFEVLSSKKSILKMFFMILFIIFTMYVVGLVRSKYFYYNLSWADIWGFYLTGIGFIDEIISFYWRYFVVTFDNFELLVLSVKPFDDFLTVFLYPLIVFLQLDNLVDFPLIQTRLSSKFLFPIGNISQIIGFFGEIYFLGGFGVTLFFVVIFSLVINFIYFLGKTKSAFRIALFTSMTSSLLMGSFVNTYIGLNFINLFFAICFGFWIYQKNIKRDKVDNKKDRFYKRLGPNSNAGVFI